MTRLVVPALHRLPAYRDALERSWSPSTTRDVAPDHLAAMDADPEDFLQDLRRHEGGTLTLPNGETAERLPARVFWLWDDGAFAGAINLRFRPGTLELPPHVSGHVGYAVVPWRHREGIATRALALVLPLAWALGLPRVLVTCADTNRASRRVIERNGGVLSGSAPDLEVGGTKLLFWVDTVA